MMKTREIAFWVAPWSWSDFSNVNLAVCPTKTELDEHLASIVVCGGLQRGEPQRLVFGDLLPSAEET